MQMMLLVASQALKDSASKNENYATSSLISTKKQTKKSKLLIKHDIFPVLFCYLFTYSDNCQRGMRTNIWSLGVHAIFPSMPSPNVSSL